MNPDVVPDHAPVKYLGRCRHCPLLVVDDTTGWQHVPVGVDALIPSDDHQAEPFTGTVVPTRRAVQHEVIGRRHLVWQRDLPDTGGCVVGVDTSNQVVVRFDGPRHQLSGFDSLELVELLDEAQRVVQTLGRPAAALPAFPPVDVEDRTT